MRIVAMELLVALLATDAVAAAQPSVRSAVISAATIKERLEVFADDSMQGRATGTAGHQKAVAFLTRTLAGLSVVPGGDAGAFTQPVPVDRRSLDLVDSRVEIGGSWRFGVDIVPLSDAFGLAVADSLELGRNEFIFGGRLGAKDAIRPGAVSGKFVIFLAPLRLNGQAEYQLRDYAKELGAYQHAAAIFVASLDLMPRAFIASLLSTHLVPHRRLAPAQNGPPVFAMSSALANQLNNRHVRERGTPQSTHKASLTVRYHVQPVTPPASNVIAIVQGSDPRLRSEYVLLSASSDYRGIASADDRIGTDSVYNGANAGGSGAVALLSIAELLSGLVEKPKRSIIFVWTAGHENGLLGAEQFTRGASVPLDNVVASISLDLLSRGRDSADRNAMKVIGAEGAMPEFSALFRRVNDRQASRLDVSFADSPGPMDRERFCDGDHWQYARAGIPSTLVTSGNYDVFATVGDSVADIDVEQVAKIAGLVADVAIELANQPTRFTSAHPISQSVKSCRP